MGGGRSCAASGSPRGCAAHPARPVGTGGGPRLPRVGLRRCDAARRLAAAREHDRLGRGARAVGTVRFPRGSPLGDPDPLPCQLFRNCLGLGRLCVFATAAASGTLGSLALTDNVPEPASVGYPQTTCSLWGRHPGGIPSAAKQRRQATPASGVPSPHVPQPSCAPSRAHTPTLGVPGSAALRCRSAVGLSPLPEVRQFAQVPTTSGQFSGRLILLVSAQSAFNHRSKSDGPASFPSGFGHTASGQSLAEPTGPEKYLAALRGASRPPLPAPGAGLCRRSEAWELRAQRGGAGSSRQEPSRGCLEPPALLGAALQRRIWQGRERQAAGSAHAHSTLPLSGGKPGWGVCVGGCGILCPAPTVDWPRLRELACDGSVAGGIRAASGPGGA